MRKAARPSGITAAVIKAAGEQAVDWLTSICNRIVKEEAITENWQKWWRDSEDRKMAMCSIVGKV